MSEVETDIPEPKMGEVWRSPMPGIEDREVFDFNPYHWGSGCVWYYLPNRVIAQILWFGWKAWAKKTGARPVAPYAYKCTTCEDLGWVGGAVCPACGNPHGGTRP